MGQSLILEAYGRVVELFGPPTARESARTLLPANYATVSRVPERSWRVTETDLGWQVADTDGEIAVRTDQLSAVSVALSFLELWVAEHARRVIFLHAGCVEVDGRAIVLPGYTLSGKTTMTAALVRAGARYLSDEYAIINTEGLVLPYARPLSLRDDLRRTVTRVAPEELGERASDDPVPVGLFALLRHDHADGWNVAPLSRAHAILALLSQTVPARSRTLDAMSALERATEEALTVHGTRGDADEAGVTLLQMIRERPPR
jgi:hypothetical protein